jgi:aldose 1-epimerase
MPSYQKTVFGQTADGQTADLFTFTNAQGMEVQITNYGAIVTSIKTHDRNGNLGEVCLGFDSLDGYLQEHPYLGAIVGRVGNRIANGKFSLDGKEYTLAVNNGSNHLHGGLVGFDKKLWGVEELGQNYIRLSCVSPDGEEGYPGTLTTVVTYTLTPDNALQIDYVLNTDQPTVANLTNHAYFNLRDGGSSSVLDHELTIHADHFLPVDANQIPTGEIRPVLGTPLDFRASTAIGARIDQADEQLQLGGGYDHSFALGGEKGTLQDCAEVYEPVSGRVMEVQTTEPGVQFYSANFLNGQPGRGGIAYQKRFAFCLETQHFPDSPNRPEFPSVVLRPGETYTSRTVYRFSAR